MTTSNFKEEDMLILTRGIGESIRIGDTLCKFTILGVKGSQVRIGLVAPPEIIIDREEIALRKKAEQREEAENTNH